MVNKLLQKELLSLMTPKSTWGIYLDTNENNGDPAVNCEWTLVTAKKHTDKFKKYVTGETVKIGQIIKTTNRYTALTKALTDKEGTILVIVNGFLSTKGSIKAQQHKRETVHTNKVSGSVPSICSKRRKKILILQQA
jgi:hypothetical protein